MSLREVGVGKPYLTIQAAFDNLFTVVGAVAFTETHTIRVYNGTYNENVIPNTTLNPNATFRLILEAAVGNSPIIDSQNIRNRCIQNAGVDYMTVDGFELKNSTQYATYYQSATYNIIKNCKVYSNTTSGLYITTGCHYLEVFSCIVYNHTSVGISLNNSITNCKIYNNTIYNNGSGISNATGGNDTEIYGNEIYGCTAALSGAIYCQTSLRMKVHNNNFHDNAGYGVWAFNTSPDIEIYENIFNNCGSYAIGVYNAASNFKIYRNKFILNKHFSIYAYNTTGGKIYNNLFYQNTCQNSITGTYTIYIQTGISIEVYNNTLYLNAGAIYWDTNSTSGICKNNINYDFWDACIIVGAGALATLTSDRNCWFSALAGAAIAQSGTTRYFILSAWQVATGKDTNSISVNPKFQDVCGEIINSLKICNNSACVGIGENLSAIFTNDYEGIIRTIPWDLGCYQPAVSVYKPIMTNQVLNDYSATQDQIITAECDVIGTPDSVVVKINGKAFVLTLVSGIHYRVLIPAYQIGVCSNQVATFMAVNAYGGVDEIAPSNLTVSANGNYDLAIIETAIVSLLTNYVPSLATILGYEPKIIPKLPAVCIWYDGFNQEQTEAVSYTITHNWVVKLYIDLTDAKLAQDNMKIYVKAILSAFKSDLNLSQTVLKEVILTGMVGALLDRNNPVLICNFNLSTITEED